MLTLAAGIDILSHVGAELFYERRSFYLVNRMSGLGYAEGWERHHILPEQCRRDDVLCGFLNGLRPLGFSLNDFTTNGMLLPSLHSVSRSAELPVHAGGHPSYNKRVIAKLHEIRLTVDMLTADKRANIALLLVRQLQKRLCHLIVDLGIAPLDSIVIRGASDCDIEAALDLLYKLRRDRKT